MLSGDIPPNQTIYVRNLNEKVKKEELKRSLYALFSQFGRISDVVALKTPKLRGQAWVVFSEITAASVAVRQMQSFPFYDKPMLYHTKTGLLGLLRSSSMDVLKYVPISLATTSTTGFAEDTNDELLKRIQYAKTKSDCIAKADGTYVPREKKKKQEEKAEKRRRAENEAEQTATNVVQNNGTNNASHTSRTGKPGAQEGAASPNSILFIQNLPHETTSMMLQMLFQQYPGFKEVRMVEAKPGISFVEYADEIQASIAMQALQGFKITPQNPMGITYAKK
ncbi:hypothetical protein AMTRI_Chr08g165870 [Amborella trichopoda]